MPRLRDLGVKPGQLPTGMHNAITDVSGVRVGHVTLIAGDGALKPGDGPVRTGVTAILPHGGNLFRDRVPAAVFTINGFGKVVGFEQIRELGTLDSPVVLTNTLNVGLAADALIAYMLRENSDIGISTYNVNPVVGETSDAFLNDIRGRHVREQHVFQAIETAASGPVVEGSVGAGTGTMCYQFKGGIGTASRQVISGQYTVGALVQTNFGLRGELLVLGAPIGQHLLDEYMPEPGPGSVMIVLATDAPLSARQLERLAVRATFGIARTGTVGHTGSGDFVIAFSTANHWAYDPGEPIQQIDRMARNRDLNALFAGAVESVEEAVLNSLVAAETMPGRDGHVAHALSLDKLVELLTYYRRL
jgi:D-aminopeptidase